MRILCFVLALFVLSNGLLANADGLDYLPEQQYEEQRQIVTEYYSSGMLENFEYGDVQTSARPGADIQIDAKSAILIEQSTGTVLYDKNCDERLPLASITKVMSLILIMEHIESGGLNLDSTVVCSEHAASMGGSQIWLEPNEEMTVNDLLKAVVIGSANDATCALAEAVCGSEEAFVAKMNERANELGMKNTYFKNCSGLDAEGHYSSARDIAIMSRKLLEYDLITQYSTVWMDTLRNGATQLVNTNKLVRFYEGTTGLKTGTTNGAGCCVTASAQRNGLHLIAVVMGADSSDKRFQAARKLLDTGFANYQFKELSFNLKNDKVDVLNGMQLAVELSKPQNYSFLLEKGQENNIKTEFKIPESIKAPVKKGDTVGRVVVKLGDKTIGTTDIKAAESVDKMNFTNAFKRMCKSIFKL